MDFEQQNMGIKVYCKKTNKPDSKYKCENREVSELKKCMSIKINRMNINHLLKS